MILDKPFVGSGLIILIRITQQLLVLNSIKTCNRLKCILNRFLYFRQFNKQRAGYSIKLLASGSSTDPEGMLANLDRFWLSNDLDPKRGDRGFIVLEQVRPGFQKTGLQRISGMQGNMLQD